MTGLVAAMAGAAPSQSILRLAVFATPLVALWVAPAPVPPSVLILVVVLGLRAAWAPEAVEGAVPPLAVVLFWGLGVPDQTDPRVLVAAALLLIGQVASTLASLGPSSYAVERETLGLWAGRAVLLVPVPVVVWLALRSGAAPRAGWPIGIGLAVVAVAFAVRLLNEQDA